MEKKHVTKFAEIAEKLRTADDKEAYRILKRMQFRLLDDAMRSLVKKDFSLDPYEAVVLISENTPTYDSDRYFSVGQGIYCSAWYNSKRSDEFLGVGLDCVNLKKIKIFIALSKGQDNKYRYFSESASDEKATITPPAKLAAIIAGLAGFRETAPGIWVKNLGRVDNLAQFKRMILPVWEETFCALKPFGDQW